MTAKVTFTILLLIALAITATSQTPGTVRFPGALDTSVSLLEVKDRATTTLNGAITSGATSITVVSTSLFPATGILTIDDERLYYTAKTSTTFTVVRGQFGSTAASHSSGATVRMNVVARHHEALRDALIAVETKLGYTSSTPTTSGHVLTVTGAGTTAWAAPSVSAILPVADTQTVVKGSADATKLIRFEVDGLTTGTTRVLTPPDANIVIAGSAAALTSGRVPFATTGGLLADSAKLTYNDSYVNSLNPAGIKIGSSAAGIYGISFENVASGNQRNFALINNYTSAGRMELLAGTSAGANPSTQVMLYDAVDSVFQTMYKFLVARSAFYTPGAPPSAEFNVHISSASAVGAIIRGAASQSANLQEWQNSSGTALAYVTSSGGIASATLTSGRVPFTTTGGLLTDSGSLLFSGTTLTVGSGLTDGLLNVLEIRIGSLSYARIGVNTADGGPYYGYNVKNTAGAYVHTATGTSAGIAFNSSNTAFVSNSSAAADASVRFAGFVENTTRRWIIGDFTAPVTPAAMLDVRAGTSSTVGQIIRGAASQSANLQEWQNSAATILASVDNSGTVWSAANTLGGAIKLGTTGIAIRQNPSFAYQLEAQAHFTVAAGSLFAAGGAAASAGSTLYAPNASTVAVDISLAASQTANALNIKNSGGTVLSAIDASGRFYAPTALTATTVGAAGGASALPATPTGYLLINVNGTQKKVPYYDN